MDIPSNMGIAQILNSIKCSVIRMEDETKLARKNYELLNAILERDRLEADKITSVVSDMVRSEFLPRAKRQSNWRTIVGIWNKELNFKLDCKMKSNNLLFMIEEMLKEEEK